MTAEAIRLPAVGAVFWTEALLFGRLGQRPLPAPQPKVAVRLTTPLPSNVSWRNRPRGILLSAPAIRFDHMPSEAERSAPVATNPITVAGEVRPLNARYHPRQFSVSLTADGLGYVPLYPSAAMTRFGEAGGVAFRLRYSDGSPAAWAIGTLSCTRNGQSFAFSGQADIAGDILIAMTGLPPLPASASADQMTLAIVADPAQSRLSAADPDALRPRQFRLRDTDPFAATQTIAFTRGHVLTGPGIGITEIILQA